MVPRSLVRYVVVAMPLMATLQASARMPQESLTVLADSFAEAILVGMKLANANRYAQGKLTAAQYQCMEKLSAPDLRETVYAMLVQSLTDDELKDAQDFFGSSAGIKYARYGVLKIYSDHGATPPEPEPRFTKRDESDLASFASRPAGKKLILDQVLQGNSARQMIEAGVTPLVRSCLAAQ